MNSYLYHLQINIDFKNKGFYKDMMKFLGWSEIFDGEGLIGYKSSEKGDVWFVDAQKKEETDYDKIGMNHMAFRVQQQSDIEDFSGFLADKKIPMLFQTPRHRPEFAASEDETYYQIIFETPDKIQIEIVYIGQK